MKLKVLGTKSPYAITMKDNCPGFFITDGDRRIVLDCGSGAHRLLNIPRDLNNLDIFLSHLHRDHYNDVFILQYASFSNHNLKRLDNPITIWLPETPKNRFEDVIYEKDAFANYNTINEQTVAHIGNIQVSFLKTDHPLETYAIKVKNKQNTIVYTSDTSFSAKDRMVKFAESADLLICESSLLTSYGFPEINSHLTAKQAAIIAKEANVKQLMLTHFWPEEEPENFVKEAKEVFQNVIAAYEGKIIDISKI